jgi:hypothetical protein
METTALVCFVPLTDGDDLNPIEPRTYRKDLLATLPEARVHHDISKDNHGHGYHWG